LLCPGVCARDPEARELGVPRSELVQESLATYLGKSAEERQAETRRARMLDALERLCAFPDDRAVFDERSSLEMLDEVRESDDSAPLRGHEAGEW